MYVTLHFDVEDTVYPPEARVDDIPGWLAETLSATGLKGTFHVIGDKARTMLERDLRDVLAKMAEHDIGIHTNSNEHPYIPELVQDCGWADGVEKLVAYETQAAEAIKAAFWKWPVAASRHAVFTAPQIYGAAAEMGLPYVYSWAYCPGHAGPVWYAGALGFPTSSDGQGPSCYLSLGLDPAFSHDDVFERKMAALREELDHRIAAGIECLTLFVCHPVRVRAKGWTERELYANGRNRTLAEIGYAYELKTPHLSDHARANFRRFCEYLRDRDDVEAIGTSQAAELYSAQPTHVTRDALYAYCTAEGDVGAPRLDPVYSPAELLTALCESLAVGEERGALPRAVERRDVIGPVEKPVVWPEKPFVTREELLGLCGELVDFVRENRHLPATVTLGEARIGLGSLHAACVAAFAAACRGDRLARLRLRGVPRYPAIAKRFDEAMGWIEEDGFFGPEFSAEKLRLHARLQSWSLKPARARVGSGPYHEAGGFVPADLVSEK